eukprot:TRINITY_DN14520_c0_g1_i2.p1 TRINITY_DN14520_c0_g1~~TRINITY_DN14520_c0_g1_i2.p1  ORF type:complete len:462 (-),score=45.66 TRINITY_DN14520_c0_g1_i2:61-1446(-)
MDRSDRRPNLFKHVLLCIGPLHAVVEAGHCDFATVDGSKLTFDTFQEKYLERQPILINNIISEWPAYQDGRWSRENLVDAFGHLRFDSSHLAGNSRKSVDFVDGTSLQVFLDQRKYDKLSWFIEPHAPMVNEMLRRGDLHVPQALSSIHREGPFLSLARRNQHNPFHAHEHNWFAQVQGSKRWYVLEPKSKPRGSLDLSDVELDLCDETLFKSFPRCTLEPGQLLYLPSQYTHGTCALEDLNVGVAFIGSSLAGKDASTLKQFLLAKLDYSSTKLPRVSTSMRLEFLSIAAAANNLLYVEQIVNSRANLQKGNARGLTPLALAVEASALDVVKYLASKVGVNGRSRGQTFLHIAASEGHIQVAKYLIEQGCDPDATDDSPMRNLPIHLAAWNGHLAMIRYLVDSGAELNRPNAEGILPWQAASFESYFYVAIVVLPRQLMDPTCLYLFVATTHRTFRKNIF